MYYNMNNRGNKVNRDDILTVIFILSSVVWWFLAGFYIANKIHETRMTECTVITNYEDGSKVCEIRFSPLDEV